MEKYFICTDEPNPNDSSKKFYHRIGELLRFETKAGGHFYKVKLYVNPTAQLSVFKDEPRSDSGARPAAPDRAATRPGAPAPEDLDLPF